VSTHVTAEPLLHVVLHQPDIPQNTGNIGRTCVAVGAKLWLIRPLGFRHEQPERNLKLPMRSEVRSLNLASTVNTVVYEAVRQFGGLPDA
jgi:tRNA(Leu) C34 or U34 (ribose-2'-O)-methylase TrmL